MRRILLGCIALLCPALTWAGNAFSIDNFTIAAGEKNKFIEVKMYNDVEVCAFQFELELPEGVSIMTNSKGNLIVNATNRLKEWDEDQEVWIAVHTVVAAQQSNGYYRVMAYATPSTNIGGTSGDAVVRIKIEASDQISTGVCTPVITKQEMTELDGTKHKMDDATYTCSATLSTRVTTLGYASFSWPKALDFTNSGLTAFIAKNCNGSSLSLVPVTKVPANTGLILKGTTGSENTYPLQTTEEATDDVSGNLLSANTEGVYTVASDDIYVLSNLDDGKPGFYIASQGIHVGQYKSYLQYSGANARQGLYFEEETTAIKGLSSVDAGQGLVFDLQGRQVKHPSAGIYIRDGKKVVVK